MRVLFATVIFDDRNFQPMGIYHLSASLKAAGHRTRVVDASSPKAVLKAIEEFKPRMLAISTLTTRYRLFQREICPEVKRAFKDIFIVIGGLHVTLMPESIGDDGIDAICRGEGDYVLVELVNRLDGDEDYLNTAGFWFKENGEVFKNPAAPLIADLDGLPMPDRGITDIYPYCRDIPIGIFITSRGCPFACTYCSNASLRELYPDTPGFFRVNSPARAVEEMELAVKRYGYKRIVIMSEVFGVQKKWLAEFAELYRSRIGLPFWCQLHPSMIDEERAEMLKEAGCATVGLGIEAGNPRLRREVLGRRVTDDQIVEGIRILHRYGIKVHAANMIGLPESDLESDLETIDLNLKAGVDFPDVSIFQPLPKTRLAERAVELGLFDGNYDDLPTTINPSAHETTRLDVPHKKVLKRLGFLFPIASKSWLVRRALPLLLKLPLEPLYLVAYKLATAWLKLRYQVGLGTSQLLNRQFYRMLLKYMSY